MKTLRHREGRGSGELEPGFEPRKPGPETVSLATQFCGLLTRSPQSGQHTFFLISGCFGASGTRSVKNSPILSNHFALTAPLPTHPHCQAPSITSSFLFPTFPLSFLFLPSHRHWYRSFWKHRDVLEAEEQHRVKSGGGYGEKHLKFCLGTQFGKYQRKGCQLV